MRKLTAVLLITLAQLNAMAPSNAALPICAEGAVLDAAECLEKASQMAASSTGSSRSASSAGGAGSASAGPSKKYYAYDRLTTGPDGQPCMTTGYYEEGSVPSDGIPANPANPQPFIYANLAESYPTCPEQPRAPGQPAPVETRAMVAARYWERIPLPKPQPSIAPGRAITGKLAYLETNGEVAHTYSTNTIFGPLEIVAKGSYTIDWGDGETTGPYAFEGKAWPDGRITHDYLNVGTYDVIVTERWTATWRFGGESGVLRALQTTGRLDDFPVEQIQAVIRR